MRAYQLLSFPERFCSVELVSITHKNISFIAIWRNVCIMNQNVVQEGVKCDEMRLIVIQGRRTTWNYWVVRNDCRGFNNLSYTIQLRQEYMYFFFYFFLWGYVKDQVYVPPLPASIPELKVRIRIAIETITADMLQTVWKETQLSLCL